MKVTHQTYWLPKRHSSHEEYEDAFWPYWPIQRQLSAPECRFAVADGATEGSFSRLWARLLTLAYCDTALNTKPVEQRTLDRVLLRMSGSWYQRTGLQELPWFALEKRARGAFATLAGLTLVADHVNVNCGEWHAFAVGDSCVVQIRDEQIFQWFPLDNPTQFGRHPELLSSLPDVNQRIWKRWEKLSTSGAWQAGDRFLLMTDALARWALTQQTDDTSSWDILKSACVSASAFASWIEVERANGNIQDDDVTLSLITLESSH